MYSKIEPSYLGSNQRQYLVRERLHTIGACRIKADGEVFRQVGLYSSSHTKTPEQHEPHCRSELSHRNHTASYDRANLGSCWRPQHNGRLRHIDTASTMSGILYVRPNNVDSILECIMADTHWFCHGRVASHRQDSIHSHLAVNLPRPQRRGVLAQPFGLRREIEPGRREA